MRYIFLDLGCYDGDTIREFKNWRHLHYPENIEWEFYGFDPNPQMIDKWDERPEKDAVFFQKAAWIHDGLTEITITDNNPYGSTVMKEKVGWGEGSVMSAPCFDFSKYLKQFRGEHVIIKMDIEGAELPVLTKMIEDKTDDIARLTLVEFHDNKMPSYHSNKGEILNTYRGELRIWR